MKTNNRKLWLIKIGFASNIYLFAMQGEVEKSMQGTPIILSYFLVPCLIYNRPFHSPLAGV